MGKRRYNLEPFAGPSSNGQAAIEGDASAEPKSAPRMLIIDDADWHRDALEGFFRKLGYETTMCNDAPAALREFLAHEPHYFETIVTDISMWLPEHKTRLQRLWLGELAGWHLCKQLRKRDFVGRLVVASTAADKALGRFLLAITLGRHGVAWLVDKRKIKAMGDDATLEGVTSRNRVFGANVKHK